MAIDLAPPAPGTIILPPTTPPRRDRALADLKPHNVAGKGRETGVKVMAHAANARRARTSTGSPTSRSELRRFHGRESNAARKSPRDRIPRSRFGKPSNGLVDVDSVSLLKDMASMLKSLSTTETRAPEDLTDDELREGGGRMTPFLTPGRVLRRAGPSPQRCRRQHVRDPRPDLGHDHLVTAASVFAGALVAVSDPIHRPAAAPAPSPDRQRRDRSAPEGGPQVVNRPEPTDFDAEPATVVEQTLAVTPPAAAPAPTPCAVCAARAVEAEAQRVARAA